MKKLRLLFTKDCPRKCPGCCNNDWKLDELPVCNDYNGYTQIMITGGEPLMYLNSLLYCIGEIRAQTRKTPIYIYTSWMDTNDLLTAMKYSDGLTITLHDKEQIYPFMLFDEILNPSDFIDKSLRLNIFEGISLPFDAEKVGWEVKKDIKWIKNCPLPKQEVFMKYKNIEEVGKCFETKQS